MADEVSNNGTLCFCGSCLSSTKHKSNKSRSLERQDVILMIHRKQPVIPHHSSDLGQVREKLDQDLEEVEIDHERKHYEAATCHDCGSCCGSGVPLAGG